MSLNHSPSIVTNGLVMYYDMNNTKKSWKGMPTTNLFGNAVNYSGLNSYWFLLDNNTNYFLISSSYNSWCMNFVCTLAASTQYTLSFEYKTSSAGTLVIDNDGVDDNTWNATINTTSEWQKYTFTRTEITAGVMTLYFRRNTGGDIEVRNVQIEANSFASGFVKGTRSTTQAIVDLTGNNTLTATSLTYNSNNTFSFNGSNNQISSPYKPSGARSFFIWVKFNTLTTAAGYQLMGVQEVGAYSYIGIINGGNIYYAAGNAGGDTGIAGATVGIWVNLGFVLNADGSHSIYKNGVSVYTTTGAVGNLATAGFTIGALNGNYWVNGDIPVVSCYNIALTATQVAQNFNVLRGRYGI